MHLYVWLVNHEITKKGFFGAAFCHNIGNIDFVFCGDIIPYAFSAKLKTKKLLLKEVMHPGVLQRAQSVTWGL